MSDAENQADRPWSYLDDMRRAELPNWTMGLANTLDEWLFRMHGISSSGHHVGVFLNLLERNGLRVAPRSESQAASMEGQTQP